MTVQRLITNFLVKNKAIHANLPMYIQSCLILPLQGAKFLNLISFFQNNS